MRVRLALMMALMVVAMMPVAVAEAPVRLYAAGSLRAAMNEIATAFTAATGAKVSAEFGASGLLRDRIAKGEPADVFASANMEPPGVARRRRGRRGRCGSSRAIACARSLRRG